MTTLNLAIDWELGPPLDDGEGGFGQVFEVTGGGVPAVAKMIPKDPGAERELLFPADLDGVRNVVPVIDQGEHGDQWVLVMPRAETSLHGFLANAGRPLSLDEALPILIDVCDALIDLEDRVVHRDLKPKNVLFLDGHWCLADFGISRYVDAATATHTRKGAASIEYAAPERWRSERATIASDVYSFGVMAFEMLVGRVPFRGMPDELREAHLHVDPPRADAAGPVMAALIDECLFKAPEARPRPTNLRRRLERVTAAPTSPGLQALMRSNRTEVQRQAEAARQASVAKTEKQRLDALVAAGQRLYRPIVATLISQIENAAPTAAISGRDEGPWSITLNGAVLTIDKPISAGSLGQLPFNVVLTSEIQLRVPQRRDVYAGRSHSLWYCDAQAASEFAWFETAFMASPLLNSNIEMAPHAMDPEGARDALGGVIGATQVAWPFTPLVVDDLTEFIDRWAGWLAIAAEGHLQHPTRMPERPPVGSWRRQ